MSNQQLATKPRDIRSLMQSDQVKNQVALALPKFLTPERMLRVCLTSVNRNPKLLECTPESLLSSVMCAAQMGIEPDGRNGHLIPRWNGKKGCNEATFMPDYKGLVALVRRNDNVADIYAEPVYDGDIFKITKGLHRDLIHEVDIRADRGVFLGAYAVIAYQNGTHSFEFMTKQEIDGIKNRSQSANSGPWVTDYTEMAKKTVIKRLLKLADLTPEIAERVASIIDADEQPTQQIEIKSANVTVSQPEQEQPRLPEPQEDQLPEPTLPPTLQEQEQEPTPEAQQDKPRRGRPPKAETKPVVAEVVVEGVSPMAEEGKPAPKPIQPTEQTQTRIYADMTAKLEEKGFTVKDLIVLCVENEWIPPVADLDNATLDCFTDEKSSAEHKLTIIFEDITEVIEELESRKEGN